MKKNKMAAKACFALATIKHLQSNEKGATAIEYALIASGIFLAIVISVRMMDSSINGMYNIIKSTVTTYVG